MAAEAIYAIKETEEKGRELIKQAGARAQQIVVGARERGEAEKQAVLQQSLQEKAEKVQAAVQKAQQRCDEIAAQGAAQRDSILSPDAAKLAGAIKLVTERIVSV